jgi:hypothetical protein
LWPYRSAYARAFRNQSDEYRSLAGMGRDRFLETQDTRTITLCIGSSTKYTEFVRPPACLRSEDTKLRAKRMRVALQIEWDLVHR